MSTNNDQHIYSVHVCALRSCEGWIDVSAKTEQEALALAVTSEYMVQVEWELVDYVDYEADDAECLDIEPD